MSGKRYLEELRFGMLLQLAVFSLGLVSATLLFLSAVAGLGMVLSSFLPEAVSRGLNVLVGALIIFFGVRMMVKKEA